jgi:hypothetical protein
LTKQTNHPLIKDYKPLEEANIVAGKEALTLLNKAYDVGLTSHV